MRLLPILGEGMNARTRNPEYFQALSPLGFTLPLGFGGWALWLSLLFYLRIVQQVKSDFVGFVQLHIGQVADLKEHTLLFFRHFHHHIRGDAHMMYFVAVGREVLGNRHLHTGAIAANTTLPVIGIPCKGPVLDGLDALLSTVQMPSGIPVATVAIDGAVNAALLSMQMLAIEDAELAAKLQAKRDSDSRKVLEKNAALEAKFNQ